MCNFDSQTSTITLCLRDIVYIFHKCGAKRQLSGSWLRTEGMSHQGSLGARPPAIEIASWHIFASKPCLVSYCHVLETQAQQQYTPLAHVHLQKSQKNKIFILGAVAPSPIALQTYPVSIGRDWKPPPSFQHLHRCHPLW